MARRPKEAHDRQVCAVLSPDQFAWLKKMRADFELNQADAVRRAVEMAMAYELCARELDEARAERDEAVRLRVRADDEATELRRKLDPKPVLDQPQTGTVFAREDCVFHYCPHPELCQAKCETKGG